LLLEKRCLASHCVGVLLIMFNRFHNHVVDELARINESGRFTKPKEGLPASAAKDAVDPYAKYDNDFFRLVV
jgi:linoleate 10R-lipoxygenase